jgi:hypothetical protein
MSRRKAVQQQPAEVIVVTCDRCGTEVTVERKALPAEWRTYEHGERRLDFCSQDCLMAHVEELR